MPANMINAEAGPIEYVTGKSSAIAPIGPMPGKTPTTVPIKTPAKQASKLFHCKAIEKP
jgi:hypothetical protein